MCNRLHELGQALERAYKDAVELYSRVERLDSLYRVLDELEDIKEIVDRLVVEVGEIRRKLREVLGGG